MSLRPIRAGLLDGVAHAFLTREGGVSGGLFASLNCGPGSTDAPEAVAENRRRAAALIGLGPEALVTLHQVHSAAVVTVTGRGLPPGPRPRADALVTGQPGLALGVLSADCAPILLADPGTGVVGAAHAGWRGALGGVIEAVLAAMRGLGAREIRAAIGPCISQRAYEVGPDLLEAFLAEDGENARFFAAGRGDRLMFDLPGFCLARLRAGGAEAEWTGHCTHSDPARFFSHRRGRQAGEADYGRLLSLVRL